MIEDRRNRPSRGETDSGAAPSEPSDYPGWPSAGHAPDADESPTDVYAALSDLAPRDAEPVPQAGPTRPDHGQPVPRDFVPPQITWSPAPEPIGVPRSPEPERFDGSRVPWSPAAEPFDGPLVPQPREPERYDGARIPWSPAPEPPPFDAFRAPGPPSAEPEPFDVPRVDWTPDPSDGSAERWTPDPSVGSANRWTDEPETQAGWVPAAPIERFEQRREEWWPGERPLTQESPPLEWVPAAETEIFDAPMIDLSASRPLPVTHRGRRRRTRTVVAVAALGAVLAGGTGYAVLRGLGLGPTTRTDASIPISTATPPVDPSAPAVAPADPLALPSSAAERQSTSASPAKTTPTTTAASPTGTSVVRVSPSTAVTVTPTTTSSPFGVRPDPPTASAGSAAPLTANLRFEESAGTGYVGTITLTNPGSTAIASWTVQVTATGATQVAVVGSGVSVTRSGDTLVFTPASGASPIAGGGTSTFAFAVTGPAGSTPSGCQVNGTPCS